jgi:CCR4-NOT transcription complex subunit 4
VKSSHGLDSKSSTVAKGKEEDKEPSGLLTTDDQGAVSSGSPNLKSPVLSRDEKSLEVRGGQDDRKPSKEMAPAPTSKKPAAAEERPADGQQPKPVPAKLKIPSGVSIGDNFVSKESKAEQVSSSKNDVIASQSGSAAPTLSGPNSRPETPATANSRISDSPAPRQPRTIRVLPTPKAETVPSLPPSASLPSSATQATAPSVLSKQRSRPPSLTSMSGPATPVGELVSDNMSATSASLSRPSSPPPGGKVGSAPVRHMTKSQAKKERQAKAKQAAEEAAKKTEDDSAKAEAEEVVQAPIIGRQKKKRRPLTGASAMEESTPDVSRPSSPPPAAVEPAPPAKVDDDEDTVKSPPAREPTPPPPSPPKASPIIKEPTKPVPRDYNAPLRPYALDMAQETKSAAQLIQEMIAEGIISKEHSFFKSPPSLSHRYDVGPGDFEEAQAAANTPLTAEQKQALRDGKPVRIRTETGKQMGRVLITPKGAVLRGFSDEDEERALALEKSILEVPSLEAFHPAPSSRLSGVPSASSMPFSSSFFPSDDNFSLNNVGYSFGLREPASGVPNLAFGLYDNDGTLSPTADEGALAKTVEETRASWEAAKKETEALQKRLDALMKKNRRLAGLV